MTIIDQISEDLNLDKNFIQNVLNNNKKFYKIYWIPKNSGGKRKIFHPSPVLKTLQYWILYNVLDHLKVSEFATGYRKGISIKDNAEVHKNNDFILNMDIKDFFYSIKKESIESVLNVEGYSEKDIEVISDICLFEGHLPIGSVTAPLFSNNIMYDFDYELFRSLPENFCYTRYADDITLSSDKFISESVQQRVEEIIIDYGFNVNVDKTRYMSKKQSQIITGLNVNDYKVTIGTKNKKALKKELYNYLCKGSGDPEKILGRLNFLKSIEPEYFDKLIVKYSEYGQVLKELKQGIQKKRNKYSRDEKLFI